MVILHENGRSGGSFDVTYTYQWRIQVDEGWGIKREKSKWVLVAITQKRPLDSLSSDLLGGRLFYWCLLVDSLLELVPSWSVIVGVYTSFLFHIASTWKRLTLSRSLIGHELCVGTSRHCLEKPVCAIDSDSSKNIKLKTENDDKESCEQSSLSCTKVVVMFTSRHSWSSRLIPSAQVWCWHLN